MKTHIVGITIISAIIVCLLSGCGIITGADIDTRDANTATTPPKERIRVNHTEAGLVVEFSGTTTLSDGTILQSQLYEDDKLMAWWPVDKAIQVHDVRWQISVPLGENGAPQELSRCANYVFKIWAKDDPSISGGTYFDLYGPPAVLYSANSNTSGEEIIINSAQSNLCDNLSFSGRTTLPDGTILRSQLYEGNKPVAWWPADRNIQVKDGRWQITLHTEETGETLDRLLLAGPTYSFTVWEKDNPSVAATIHFDLPAWK